MIPNNLAIVDVETTGLNPVKDRIIDIAILRIENGELKKSFSSLVNPDIYIPKEIEILTGIHGDELAKAPTFSSIYDDIMELLEDSVFVAHNARFDYSFIKSEISKLGKSYNAKLLCTAKLFRSLSPGTRHNLDALIAKYNFSVTLRHRAYPDAKVLMDYLNIIKTKYTSKVLKKAIDFAMNTPRVPNYIDPKIIENLPENPGIYQFFGENDAPLYIGKSINIKNRVLSHFTDSLKKPGEQKIYRETRSISCIATTGELSALLLESELIKKHSPIYNKQLRYAKKLKAITKIIKDNSFITTKIIDIYEINPEKIASYIGVFKNEKQAKDYLLKKAKEYKLCPKLLNIEKTNNSCFWYSLGWCSGACIEKESVAKYNLRFTEAFQTEKFKPWPFKGPIAITEHYKSQKSQIIVDKWCVLSLTTWDNNLTENFKNTTKSFSLDTYKILERYIFKDKNQKYIAELKKGEIN